jgi:hypothetical protein
MPAGGMLQTGPDTLRRSISGIHVRLRCPEVLLQCQWIMRTPPTLCNQRVAAERGKFGQEGHADYGGQDDMTMMHLLPLLHNKRQRGCC